MKKIRDSLQHLAAARDAVVSSTKKAWRRLTTEPGYADALAAAAVAGVALFSRSPRVTRFVQEIAGTLAVLVDTLIRNKRAPGGYEWGLEPRWE